MKKSLLAFIIFLAVSCQKKDLSTNVISNPYKDYEIALIEYQQEVQSVEKVKDSSLLSLKLQSSLAKLTDASTTFLERIGKKNELEETVQLGFAYQISAAIVYFDLNNRKKSSLGGRGDVQTQSISTQELSGCLLDAIGLGGFSTSAMLLSMNKTVQKIIKAAGVFILRQIGIVGYAFTIYNFVDCILHEDADHDDSRGF